MAKPSLAPFAVAFLLSALLFLAACGPNTRTALTAKRTSATVTPYAPTIAGPILEPEKLEEYSTRKRKPGAVFKAEEDEDEDEAEEEEREREEAAEAMEFYLSKRTPEPEAKLPMERYYSARQQAQRMRQISLSTGRFSSGNKAGSPRRQISLGSWKELGPANIAGRSRILVFHPQDPNIMFVGAAAGGVYKTVDGGQNWTAIGDLLPNMAVNALAIDPNNPNILYAGTGEGFGNSDAVRGIGIFKTTDGGATWTALSSTYGKNDFFFTNRLIVSPFDTNRIYAATSTGIWRSLDGGENWKQVLNRATPFDGCQDLVIRKDQGRDYLFASCGRRATPASIFRNKNAEGDDEWEIVYADTNMARSAIAIAPSNPDIVYVIASSREEGNWADGLYAVFRSTSAGDKGSWEVRVTNQSPRRMNTVLLSNQQGFFSDLCTPGGRQSFANQGWYDIAIAVDPVNPDRVWVGGIDWSVSTDGGANWGLASDWNVGKTARTYVHADQHFIIFHPQYDGDKNKTVFFTNDGGVFKTDDALAEPIPDDRAFCTEVSKFTHKELSRGLATGQFYHGVVYPGGHVFLGGKQDNGTNRGGLGPGMFNWTSVFGGDGGYVAVAPDDPNRLYLETTRLSLRRSTNGGFTTAGATTGITEASANFLFITPFRMDPNDSQRLYIGGRTLWRTANGGSSWTAAAAAIPTGTISAYAIAPGSSDRVLFGTTTGRVYRSLSATTTTAADTWDFSFARLNGNVSWLEIDPKDPDTAYATISTFNNASGSGHVFKTTNAGVTWTSIDGSGDTAIPDVPAHSIAIDPNNTQNLYLGTDIGIFASTDGGASWSKEDSGFVNTVVESMTITKEDGASTLYAFTHGRGVWKVNLNGETPKACNWKLEPSSPLNLPAFGGPTTLKLGAESDCLWSAVPGSTWAVFPTATGTGAADVTLNVAVNTSTIARTATVQVGPQALTVNQSGATLVTGNATTDSAYRPDSLPFVSTSNTREFPAPNPEGSPVHSCSTSVDSRGNYYVLTPDFAGTLQITVASSNANGLVLTAYEGSVAAANEKLCTRAVSVNSRLTVEKDKTYYLQISGLGTNNAGGTQILTLSRIE